MNNWPKAFEDQLNGQLGADTAGVVLETMKAHEPPTSIRINPQKVSAEMNLRPVPWSKHGFYLPERPLFTTDPWLHSGAYYVQEASSMAIEPVIVQEREGKQEALRVLDLCAAPGGKTTHIASLLGPEDLLVANDVIQARSRILFENVVKSGTDTLITQSDPRDFARLGGFFNVLLVDAPCSGEGMFRKDPSAMDEWSTEHVAFCSSRQQRILTDVWDTLCMDGLLIYSTCTFNKSENEDVLAWLIANHEVAPVAVSLPSENVLTYEIGDFKGYKMLPGLVEGEGFCFFVVRKKEGIPLAEIDVPRKKNNHRSKVREVPGLIDQETLTVYEKGELAFATRFMEESNHLGKKLKLIKSGTQLGEWKHQKFIPSHEWALSELVDNESWNNLNISLEQSIDYLMKDSILIDQGQRGFNVVNFENIPLGWVNHLGNRTNNLYPANWRIQKDFRNQQAFTLSQFCI